MRRLFCVGMVVLLLTAGCAAVKEDAVTPGAPDEVGAILTNYRSWASMFEAPRNVSAILMLLCRTMTTAEESYINSPHAEHFVQVFANPAGAETMWQEGARTFPQGSVIVKEKWSQDSRFQLDTAQREPAGLGIMVKREAGFDAVGGDWEYLYMDRAGQITRDQKQMQECRACHMAQRARDSVYFPAVLAE